MMSGPSPELWLELVLILGGEVALLVGVAALLERLIRASAWQRVLWQACLLGFASLLLLELTGASRGVVHFSESILLEGIGRDHDLMPTSPSDPPRGAAPDPSSVLAASPDLKGPPRVEEPRLHEEKSDGLEGSREEAGAHSLRLSDGAPRFAAWSRVHGGRGSSGSWAPWRWRPGERWATC